jgi:hypothetical protein
LILFSFLLTHRGEAPVENTFLGKGIMGQAEHPPIILKTYDFTLWLLPKVEKFNRAYRFTVGERLVSHALDLLLDLVQAAYSAEKTAHLDRANLHVNAVRYLLRLAKDLKLLNLGSWEHAAERLDEIGRMVGGWQKASARRA